MKKAIFAIGWILLFAQTHLLGQAEPLANEGKAGLYVKSLEHVLRLEDDEIDLATATLISSEQWSIAVHGRRYLSILDDMAFEVRDRLEAKRLPVNYKAIPVINKYLFDELGFRSVKKASNPNDLFLHTVVDRRRGYCLSLSILYLSIGERLGLPLYGVVAPGHFFIRYDDGRMRFNIETTSNGGNAPDKHYIDKFNVPEGNNLYMVNLNKIQTLGCFFNNLGNSYIDVGDWDAALLALERAVEINPSLGESRTNLGNIYLQMDQTEDAIYEYETALEINPNDAKTYNNLGNAYAKLGWMNDAISQYLKSLELDAKSMDAYKNLAAAYCKQKMFKQAIAQLKRALIIEPRNASVYSQSGDVYVLMGDREQAIFQYRQALKMEPDMLAALVSLGNMYFEKQDLDAAIEQYRRAIQINPDDNMIHHNLGAAYSNKGLFEEAVAEYLSAIELEPKMGGAHNGLAIGFYNLGKYDLAWKHVNTAQELGVQVPEDLITAIKHKLR